MEGNRKVLTHPGAKGTATELDWINVLEHHIPKRYEISKAFVIDSKGHMSDEIDIVIYDRQYTPVLYNKKDQRIVPAESVYAVFEVKPKLNKANIKYASKKAASVRFLERTSAPITYAGGEFEPRPPFRIIAGILTYQSSWNPVFGETFESYIRDGGASSRLDLGCVVKSGSFDMIESENGNVSIHSVDQTIGLAYFFLRLLQRLQSVGTVTAIDYNMYMKVLEKKDL